MSVSIDPMQHKDGGFSLLETLVALAVFAMIVGAVQFGLSQSWRASRLADGQQAALSHAKRLMAEVGISRPIGVGREDGTVGEQLTWSVTIENRDVAAFGPLGALSSQSIAAYWVNVRVSWRDRTSGTTRDVALRTLKLAERQP